jgi:flagellar motor switch protein FliN/FliY
MMGDAQEPQRAMSGDETSELSGGGDDAQEKLKADASGAEPAAGGDPPSDGAQPPAEGVDAPAEGVDAPAEGVDAPAEGVDVSPEARAVPEEGGEPSSEGDAPDDVAASGPPALDQIDPGVGPEAFGEGSTARQLDVDQEEGGAARPVEFGQLSGQKQQGSPANIEMLLDVHLPVTVELGRNQIAVKEILDFGPGSIVELKRLANEPVDILVNGVLVARGEVVVIEDHFGVRLTSLISPEERIRCLGGNES